jgi:hypothetical protein
MSITPTLRERILAAFSGDELVTFCADHFPEVAREFTTGMTASQRLQLLLGHCGRHQCGERLLDLLERERPSLIGTARAALLADLVAQTILDDLLTQQPQKVVNATGTITATTISGGEVVGVKVNVILPPPLPPPSPRHQLRAPVSDFVGREEEIGAIVRALQPVAAGSTMTISGLRGMGGIGKTELAFAAAQYLAPLFPDAQIVIPLRGTSVVPLSPA